MKNLTWTHSIRNKNQSCFTETNLYKINIFQMINFTKHYIKNKYIIHFSKKRIVKNTTVHDKLFEIEFNGTISQAKKQAIIELNKLEQIK